MKNKKTQRILLLCVLVVWGLIFYKVFNYIKKDETVKSDKLIKSKQSKNNVSMDSIHLLLNYTDPFHLSRPLTAHTYLNNGNKLKSTLKENPKKEILLPIPKIIYKGTIYNQFKHRQIGVVIFNQNSYFLSEGDSIQNWKISKIFKDSILISHLNQKGCINILK